MSTRCFPPAGPITLLAKREVIFHHDFSEQGPIKLNAIFANPICRHLLGRFDENNKLLASRWRHLFGHLSERAG